MDTVYYIKNKQTYEYLNKKGGWNRSRRTYNLATFNDKDAATAAVPKDVDCFIEPTVKKENKVPENAKFILYFKGKVFNKKEEFVFAERKDDSLLRFASENDAVAKALSLDLDMDFVELDTIIEKPKEAKK